MDVEEPAENNMRPVQTQWQLEECLNIVKDWLYFNRSLAREAA
jgi:hypothetical protein